MPVIGPLSRHKDVKACKEIAELLKSQLIADPGVLEIFVLETVHSVAPAPPHEDLL